MCLVKQYLGLECTGFCLLKQYPNLGFTKTKFCLGVLRLNPFFKASPVLGTRDKSCFEH